MALSQRDRCNTLWRRAQGIIRKNVRLDHWRVGVIDAPIHALLTADRIPPVRWLNELTRGEFLADPFGIIHDGRLTLLCESFDYRTARGTITSIDGPAECRVRRERVLIGPNVHLSYPYLVEHEGGVFCIPETHEAREIGLYRADPFPRRWLKIATLVAGFAGVDATVFRHEGRWWLACTDADHEPNRDLHLWYAADLLGPWQPHAGNPVKRDLRSARPAGTPFVHEGCLYRPAQDCSHVYGGQVVINRDAPLPYGVPGGTGCRHRPTHARRRSQRRAHHLGRRPLDVGRRPVVDVRSPGARARHHRYARGKGAPSSRPPYRLHDRRARADADGAHGTPGSPAPHLHRQ